MLVGVPKEIKDNEFRVGLVPSTVRELTSNGHQVLVETNAGVGAGLTDDDYKAAGAKIAAGADDIFARADMIVKVKEPLAPERKKLRRGQILFTYLHLAADRAQTDDLVASGVTAIAYETVTSSQGTLPLLTPMSEVAGRMAPHVGARCLEKENGGRGVLLGGVPGVPRSTCVVPGNVPPFVQSGPVNVVVMAPPPYPAMSSTVPWMCRMLTGLAGLQRSGSRKLTPARVAMPAMRSACSQAIR
jgi:alanine dehydrogenase